MATLIIIDDPPQPWELDWQRRCLERLLINMILFRRAIREGYTVKRNPLPHGEYSVNSDNFLHDLIR